MTSQHVIHDYIAGSIGGAAGIVAGHPFDTVKVQIQTQEYGGKYSNLLEVYKTVKSQSLTNGFFRGLSWPLISYGGANALFFGMYGFLLKKFNYEEAVDKPPQYWTIGLASALGTLPTLFLTCPVEVIKIMLQSQIPHKSAASSPGQTFYKGPIEATKSIFRMSGLKGFYRGFLTLIVRDSPANTMYMVSYTMFQYQGKQLIPSVPSQVVNFIGGGFAGVLSWSVILPFDVIKSKIQADPAKQVYKGFWDCAGKVYASQGVRAFFLGFTPLALRAFPVNAITLMVYSETLIYLAKLGS